MPKPKIISHKMTVPGAGEFQYTVRFDVYNAKFFIELPQKMIDALGYDEVEDDSFLEVEKKFAKVIKRFIKNPKSTKTKVICFQFEPEAMWWEPDGNGKLKRHHIGKDTTFYHNEKGNLSINFLYEILYRVKKIDKGGDGYDYFNLDGKKTYHYGPVIPWSEEREAFCKEMMKTFITFTSTLVKMIPSKLTELTKMIDDGFKFPPIGLTLPMKKIKPKKEKVENGWKNL